MFKRFIKAFFVYILIPAVFFAIFINGSGWNAITTGVPLDDVFIHYRIAYNVATGAGLSFNPGEISLSSTSNLWVFLLSFMILIFQRILIPSKILSLILLLCSGFILKRIIKLITNSELFSLLTIIQFISLGRVLWLCFSGMETMLYIFILLLNIHLIIFPIKHRIVHFALHGFALGFLILTRPEGFLFVVLVLVFNILVILNKIHKETNFLLVKEVLISIFLPILTLLWVNIPIIILYFRYGVFLPNSFEAKGGGHFILSKTKNYISETIRYSFFDNPIIFFLIIVIFGLLLIALIKNYIYNKKQKKNFLRSIISTINLWIISNKNRAILISCLFVLCVYIFYSLYAPFTWQHLRYTVPLIPLIWIIVINIGLWSIDILGYSFSNRIKVLFLIITTIALIFNVVSDYQWGNIYRTNWISIYRGNVLPAKWIKNNTYPADLIACQDIGAIGLISKRYILDIEGIATKNILIYKKNYGRIQGILKYLQEKQPAYLVISDEFYPGLTKNKDIFFIEASFNIPHHSIGGGSIVKIYKCEWNKK